MADKGAGDAQRKITESTATQRQLLNQRLQQEYWKKNAERIRGRNRLTGLAIGAFVIGIFSYTILSVRQETIMDEIDNEAKIKAWRGPRTGANS